MTAKGYRICKTRLALAGGSASRVAVAAAASGRPDRSSKCRAVAVA